MEKQIFELVDTIGDCKREKFHIYNIDCDDGMRYRVDCGDLGSFETGLINGEEHYDLKSDSWIYVEGYIWTFSCLSTTYDGYPKMNPEQAFKILQDDKQTIKA